MEEAKFEFGGEKGEKKREGNSKKISRQMKSFS